MDPSGYGPVAPPGGPFFQLYLYGSQLFGLLVLAFTIWMIVDCLREGRPMLWIWLMFVFPGIAPLAYFINYKLDASAAGSGLFKGYWHKQRVRELQAKVHHLDTAYHYDALGDEFLRAKKYPEARAAFEASLARDPKSFEARAHLGFSLLGEGRAEEAWRLLEPALAEKPDFEYGELMWNSARALAAMGRLDESKSLYQKLLARNYYAQARLEFAEVLRKTGDEAGARALLERVVADGPHAPKFQQKRDRKWVRQARRMLRR